MTTGITMNSDFATNRFDRECVAMLVQGGSIQRGEVGKVCLTFKMLLATVRRVSVLITWVRPAHMWSVVRWSDSWD